MTAVILHVGVLGNSAAELNGSLHEFAAWAESDQSGHFPENLLVAHPWGQAQVGDLTVFDEKRVYV